MKIQEVPGTKPLYHSPCRAHEESLSPGITDAGLFEYYEDTAGQGTGTWGRG
jgi:hypothetical protein